MSVYHTPEMQQIVADVIGRFVNGTQDPHVLGLRVVAVDNPNWRSSFISRLRPISVQSTGIDAWLLSKEDAALLLAELRGARTFANNRHRIWCTLTVSPRPSRTCDRACTCGPIARECRTTPGWAMTWIEARFRKDFRCRSVRLLSQDERTIDAVLKCNVDQVEKLSECAG